MREASKNIYDSVELHFLVLGTQWPFSRVQLLQRAPAADDLSSCLVISSPLPERRVLGHDTSSS